MTYREKTPTVISVLQRKLKAGKTLEDFQKAHLPNGTVEKTRFGYDVDFFSVPTRVINSVSMENPSIIISIGMSYGTLEDIFKAAMESGTNDAKDKGRSDSLDDVCDDLFPPIITCTQTDNNYGGKNPDYTETPLAEVTKEIQEGIKKLFGSVQRSK